MLNTWPKDEDQTHSPQSQAHVPCEYIANIVRGSHRQDFHLLASWDGPSNNLCPSFPTQPESSQVPDGDERATVTDAVDDEPFAAWAELPLSARSGGTRPCGLYATPRGEGK